YHGLPRLRICAEPLHGVQQAEVKGNVYFSFGQNPAVISKVGNILTVGQFANAYRICIRRSNGARYLSGQLDRFILDKVSSGPVPISQIVIARGIFYWIKAL